MVPPVPDGSCDLTSHVAIDACEEAGRRAGAGAGQLLRQAAALRGLGVEPASQASSITAAGLRHASEAAELLDVNGLGAFWWLVQSVGIPVFRSPLR